MSKRNILTALTSLMLAIAACTPQTTTSSTAADTAGGQITTTTAATSSTGSVAAPENPDQPPRPRPVNQVDCGDAPDSVVIVCEAYDLIKTRYVDDIDDATLALAAIQGLELLDAEPLEGELVCVVPVDEFAASCDTLAIEAATSTQGAEAVVMGLANFGLDANSVYLDEQALELVEEEQEGEVEGIGALVSPEDPTLEGDSRQCSVVSETCRISIVSTIAGSPAEDAGLQRDDVIVAVDGNSIVGWTVDEVTAKVRGPAGTPVTLTIERGDEAFDVTIVRAAVVVPVIETEVVDDTGYVRLRVFNQNADEQFESAIVGVLSEGVENLIVDLRDNPGGLLDTAIAVTSAFLPDGDVIVTEGPDQTVSYPVTGSVIVPADVEVVLLVNRGSASASEVVSATLQERGVATVVGENTFGKNTVQQRFRLSNGGALKLTVARWLTPGGLDFGGAGVTPDVELSLDTLTDVESLVRAVLAAT